MNEGKGLKVLIGVLLICVISLRGYIVYYKLLNKSNTNTVVDNKTNNDEKKDDNDKKYEVVVTKDEDDNYKYFVISNKDNFYSVYSIKNDEIKMLTDVSEYYRTDFEDGSTNKEVDSIRVENGVLYILTNYKNDAAEFKYFFNNGSYGRVKTTKISYVGVAGAK